jgi:hypothetical protein
MGCGMSRDENEAQLRAPRQARGRQQRAPPNIGAPTEVTIHIPRNRTDSHGFPIPSATHEMDRPTLENALTLTAGYLHRRNAQLTVIAVGGAINIIFLNTRNSTHDVDIFGSNLDIAARMLLDEAMQYAIQQSPSPLGTDWMNTENQMWLSPNLHRELTDEAIQQDVTVFNSPGLRVLAAPWEYAFSGKVQRQLTGGNQARPYDLSDAVHYLNRIINPRGGSGGRPVPMATIEELARRFNHATNRNFLMNRVNAEYRRRYGSNGIV